MLKRIAVVFIVFLVVGFFVSAKKETIAQITTTTLGQWRETAPFTTNSDIISHQLSSFARGNYFYVLTMNRNALSPDPRIIYKAQQQANGNLGNWSDAMNNHATGPQGFTVTTAENSIYHSWYGLVRQYNFDGSGNITGYTNLEKLDGSGNEISIPDPNGGYNEYVWDTTVFVPFDTNKYIFHLGGWDMRNYGYELNLYRINYPINNPAEFQYLGRSTPERSYKAAFYRGTGLNYGYIYTQQRDAGKILKIRVNSDGSVGSWQDAGSLPPQKGSNMLGDMFIIDNQLFIIRGKGVYRNQINPTDGNLSAWDDSPPDLPNEQIIPAWTGGHPEGASYGIIGNYIYVTGNDRVYFSQILRPGQATETPAATATTAPPTATPTPLPACTQNLNKEEIKLSFQVDPVQDTDKFKTAGGLKYKAINTDRHCYISGDNVEIEYKISNTGNDFYTKNALAFPDGHYEIYLWGPRNIKQKFSGITLSASSTEVIDCTLDTPPAACGDFGNSEKRAEKKLLSGDANSDNAVNLLDFEILRENIGKEGNNPADFNYDGKAAATDENILNDFDLLRANFGKAGVK